MRFVIYVKTGNTESLLYDSEAGSQEYFIGDPKLRIELNKAGAFTFTILPSHPLYNSFLRMRTYVRILLDDEEIYRGRVIQIDDSTWMERSIQCEGDLAYLNDSIQYPDQTESTTQNSDIVTNNNAARDRITDAEQKKKMPSESITIARVNLSAKNANHESIQNHFIRFLTVHSSQMNTPRDFGIGNITVDDKDTVQDFTSTNYRDTLSAIEDDLLKYYGGFLQTRRSGDIVYLDWLKTPGGNATQPIKMGMNLIDIQQQASDMNAFSRLIPVGDNQLTIESVNDNKNYIQNDSVYNKYGAIYKTESFSDVTTAAELKRQARAWMKKNCKDEPISLTVEAIDMHLLDGSIEAIKLGTRVNVVSEPHGISLNLYVTSIEYDIQNPENNTYEIGDPYETLSQKTKKKKQSTEKSISSASTSAKSASRRAGNLEQAVNRHAQTISDVATGLYNIQADTLNISAKVVTIEADELTLRGKVTTIEGDLLDIHTKALKIDGETVEITSDYAIIGNIIMGNPPGTSGDYEMHLIGDTLLQGDLDVGGEINVDRMNINVETDSGGLYINDEKVNILDIEQDTQNPNVLHIYKADGTRIDFSRATTLSGTWSGSLPAKTLTVSTDDPQGPSYVVQFEGTYSATRTNLEVGIGGSISIETVMGAKMLSIPVNVSRLTGTSSEPDIVYQTNINAVYNTLLTSRTGSNKISTNGTYTPGSDYIGYSSVEVDVPDKDVGTRFGAGNGNYWVEGFYRSESGAPTISDSTMAYKLETTGSKAGTIVQIKYPETGGTKIPNSAELTVGSLYTEGLNDVAINKGTWSGGQISFTKSAGTASTKSVQLTAATPVWNGNAATVRIWDGQTADVQQGGLDTGYDVTVNAESKLTSLTASYNGNYTPSSNYIGYSSVKVRVPNTMLVDAAAGTATIGTGGSSSLEFSAGITYSTATHTYVARAIVNNVDMVPRRAVSGTEAYDAGNANRASQVGGLLSTTDTVEQHLSAGTKYQIVTQYQQADGTWANGGTLVVDTPENVSGEVTIGHSTGPTSESPIVAQPQFYAKLNGTTQQTLYTRMYRKTYANGNDNDHCVNVYAKVGSAATDSDTLIARISTQAVYNAGWNAVTPSIRRSGASFYAKCSNGKESGAYELGEYDLYCTKKTTLGGGDFEYYFQATIHDNNICSQGRTATFYR